MVPPEEEDAPELKVLWLEAWDDITGQELDAKKVEEARRLEVESYETNEGADPCPEKRLLGTHRPRSKNGSLD